MTEKAAFCQLMGALAQREVTCSGWVVDVRRLGTNGGGAFRLSWCCVPKPYILNSVNSNP